MHELRLPSRYRRDASQKLLWFLENYGRKDYAERWAVALKETEDAIAADPLAFPLIREEVDFDYPLREAWFGVGKKRTHRVIFAICDTDIVAITVRHASEQDVKTEEL